MTRNEITASLKQIVEPYVEDKEALAEAHEDSTLLGDLKIDSMNLVDIILDAEEAFSIEIDDDAAARMTTVGEAVTVIEELVSPNET